MRGCVNDANEMAALLQKLLGFDRDEITLLRDHEATKRAILEELEAMVDGAEDGAYSYLFFSLSTRGTQVADLDGAERDRADEAYCPSDLQQKGDQWDPECLILDDEMRDLFARLPTNALLEAVMDTSHCGAGLRAADMLLDRRPRFLPPPTWDAFSEVDGRQPRGLSRGLLEAGVTHHVLWTSCRSDQVSAEARISGEWHGAFTYFLCKEMYACGNALPRQKLLEKARADLAAAHFGQTPQLECSTDARQAPPG